MLSSGSLSIIAAPSLFSPVRAIVSACFSSQYFLVASIKIGEMALRQLGRFFPRRASSVCGSLFTHLALIVRKIGAGFYQIIGLTRIVMSKLLSAAAAVVQIKDGMTIGIGGWGPRRKPMALVRELLRSDVKDLTVVAYGGADVGMLCAAGKVKKLIFAFVSLDFIPLEPYFRKARQSGAIEVMEIDEGMMVLGLRAAGFGAPYIPTAIGLGTDIITKNSLLKVIDSPYDDKAWVAMPDQRPGSLHGRFNRARCRKNLRIVRRAGTDRILPQQSRRIALCILGAQRNYRCRAYSVRRAPDLVRTVVRFRYRAFQRVYGVG
jgi:acyl CoA:acetate/3-ketoacid CoA transferase alpha subunit